MHEQYQERRKGKMEIYVIDYGANGAGWTATYSILNANPVQHTISIKVRNSAGKLKGTESITIKAYAQHILDVTRYVTEDFGRHSLYVEGPDNLFIKQFFSNDEGGFGMAQGQPLSGGLKK